MSFKQSDKQRHKFELPSHRLPGCALELRDGAENFSYNALMIPSDFIQTLLDRVDIVSVIDPHVALKKSGSNYVACCPFHNEKTPSFTVSESKQFYHCFGCGVSGSALGFLMEYASLGFVDAVKQLAESVGLAVPQQEQAASHKSSEQQDRDVTEVLAQALRFYRQQLKSSQAAIAYLKQRDVSGQIAARFGIGYAPAGWQNLAAIFSNYNAKILQTAGLVVDGEAGKRYDRFRDRIMFPILSQRGDVIGFGGRVLNHGEPKYLNSPETPTFEKGRELYGLRQATKAIRAAGRIVVVEGYMDVVALAQHGIEYVVATLGTATSAVHIQRLLRLTDLVVFCFDGDEAGKRAAWRACEVSLAHLVDGKQVAFLFLPQGEDPDSFVRHQGREGFERLLPDSMPLSAYLVQGLMLGCDLKSEQGRAALLQSAKPLMKQISAPMLSLMLRKRLAELAGIDREELDRLLDIKHSNRVPAPPKGRRNIPLSTALSLAGHILCHPRLAQELNVPLVSDADDDVLTLIALVEFCRAYPNLQGSGQMIEHFRDSPHQTGMHAAAAHALTLNGFPPAEVEASFRDGVQQLLKSLRRKGIDAILERARVEGPTEAVKQALKNAQFAP